MTLHELLTPGCVYACIVLILLSIIVIYWYTNVPYNLPPGSAGLPILGYMPFFRGPVHTAYSQLAKRYGPIFHLYLGNRLVIVLNDWEAIKDAFVRQADVFAGRIRDANFAQDESNKQGVANADGEQWRQHRRFVSSYLRKNGYGNPFLETILLNEIRNLMEKLRNDCGKATAMRDLLYCSFSNNVHQLVTGNHYSYGHPTIQRMIRVMYSFAEHGRQIAYHTVFPWISYIPGLNRFSQHKERWGDVAEMLSIIKEIIEDRKCVHQLSNGSLCDSYLAEIKKGVANQFSKSGLLHVCRDLLTAGAEELSNSLLWGMIYLTNNPLVQHKVQLEIDSVIGQEREPSYNDRFNTPYTVAMINEVLRIASTLPLALPHRCTQQTKVLGYTIPEDTMTVVNIWGCNNDPRLWGDPENFRPERFIGSDGQLNVPEYFIPFSVGKRACAGAPFARMQLYLYFTSLLQNFELISFDGFKLPLEARERATRFTLFDNFCFQQRLNH